MNTYKDPEWLGLTQEDANPSASKQKQGQKTTNTPSGAQMVESKVVAAKSRPSTDNVAKQETQLLPDAAIGKEVPQTSLQKGAEIDSHLNNAQLGMKLFDDVVMKNYMLHLEGMDVVESGKEARTDNIILYKINKMVYEKDEYATDKYSSVIGAMTYANCSIVLIVNGKGNKTDFYLGVKSNDTRRTDAQVAESLTSALKGQFPGVEYEDMSTTPAGMKEKPQDGLFKYFQECNSVSTWAGVPALKNSKGDYTNATFIQGLEKFATAMQGKVYTAVIIASNNSAQDIKAIRDTYAGLYTQLSAMATQQVAYSTNESMADAMSRTVSTTDTTGTSETWGTNENHSTSTSHSDSTNWSKGESHENKWATASKVLSAVSTAIGTAAVASGIGAPIGVAMLGLSAAAGVTGLKAGTVNSSAGGGSQDTTGEQHGTGSHHDTGTNESHSEGVSTQSGKTATVGESKNFTINIQNKHYQDAMKRIDKQLERLDVCEGTGLWSTAAYFLSYGTDRSTAEMASGVFRSIMQGEQSGVEQSSINTWFNPDKDGEKYNSIVKAVSRLDHPMFVYRNPMLQNDAQLAPTAFLSSKEVAMIMGLPRKSVPGFPVSEHISLAKEVVRLDGDQNQRGLMLGKIFDHGKVLEGNNVWLDRKSLTQHTFVTGSTGCGKSNTIYYLIDQIANSRETDAPKFLIIEPAKGEYKDVFGNENVYGTNPKLTRLLRINPFRFPKGVHVLEHIDRLIEIFNVCWPMYAAMPAVLKEATLKSYEDCGWDLYKSENEHSENMFPTFADLLNNLYVVINNSAYSEEVKSNYIGSLVTRVKSLTNGINKEIFSGREIGDMALFDENVIVDLSRIGSQETKSLIMGILIMRLSEYRANSDIEHNSKLRHITVLEEAHNILKRCSTEANPEGSNVAGKSVEMLTNAIAEMRTYGEGFIIVDQSPSSVDISAIKNTNTKIIMRLPEDGDRKTAGKSAGMKDDQVDEIAKLPTGVAVVYQNNWEDPVMCMIGKYKGEPHKHHFMADDAAVKDDTDVRVEAMKLLLKNRAKADVEVDVDKLEDQIGLSELSTATKIALYKAIDEIKSGKPVEICRDGKFGNLSAVVTDIMQAQTDVVKITQQSKSWVEVSEQLLDVIQKKLPDFPDQLNRELMHSLMYHYGMQNEVCRKTYNAWLTEFKTNQIL